MQLFVASEIKLQHKITNTNSYMLCDYALYKCTINSDSSILWKLEVERWS